MPRDRNELGKHRACSKGCNQLVKVHTSSGASGEAGVVSFQKQDASINDTNATVEPYSLVVCTSHKQVICKPPEEAENGDDIEVSCETNKEVKATVTCEFDPDVWNLGGTCISNHVYNLTVKLCPDTMIDAWAGPAISRIPKLCRKSSEGDDDLCSKLAMSF